MQSYTNRRTKPELKCSREQNTPPQKSEASSLTKMFDGSCIGYLTKEEEHYKERQLLIQDYIGPTRRSIKIFPANAPQCALNLDDVIFRLVVTISGNLLSANRCGGPAAFAVDTSFADFGPE